VFLYDTHTKYDSLNRLKYARAFTYSGSYGVYVENGSKNFDGIDRTSNIFGKQTSNSGLLGEGVVRRENKPNVISKWNERVENVSGIMLQQRAR